MGFIPFRETKDNAIKVLTLVHYANRTDIPYFFLSTNAEKPFDKVNWTFMFAVLKDMGFGDQMLQWITCVYLAPQALVKVNGVFSYPFFYIKWYPTGLPSVILVVCPFVRAFF